MFLVTENSTWGYLW